MKNGTFLRAAVLSGLVGLLCPAIGQGQCTNLVPNGSFEIFSALPDDDCDWFLATGWTNAATSSECNSSNGSPDYYHELSPGGFASTLPSNLYATLDPFDGQAVMGLGGYLSFAAEAREYLGIELTCPLVPGATYDLQFQITTGSPNVDGFFTDGWAVALTENPLLQPAGTNGPITGVTPQFRINGVVANPGWQTVSFTFTATEAARYLTFGNFLTDAQQTRQQNGPSVAFALAYVFVDAFSLTPAGATPTLVLEDITRCTPPTAVDIAPGPFACATYAWSTGATTPTITLTAAGTYGLTVTTPCGILTDDFTLTFGGAAATISEEICAGTPFVLNGQSYTTAGTYVQNLTAVNGCDSTLTLELSVVPALTESITEQTCAGTPFVLNGQSYTTAGTYVQNLTAVNGCDSTLTLELRVGQAQEATLTAQAEQGTPFVLNGEVYTSSGTYVQNLTAANGCDSVLTLNLRVGEENIYIPNAISPNGDGINDFFKPYAGIDALLTVQSLLVFDRWGGNVFELSGPSPLAELVGWDGNSRGKAVAPGNYVYQLVLERPDGSRVVRKGELVVVD
ncbi:gliding motility-associated C-terminal domain-containing protein [Neolewinella lacunae]|uniref:Gliding motility-associated C-terminal domain-containing protein n=1 Tax=Neolewinella lacunae TaxID=1517758 RepID=A0A923PJM3_9BACT|nr:gliding motility-associated C-terminal domain-containing protein [Neolewinella lacunae]MBC6992941.1 gliding motility-associated C-terminal domain-containing protein [Neolewinella lacunae]MDN3633695.1 gliding motility-associated C-terminal domain-containing protein [Neolewinella lacunae]